MAVLDPEKVDGIKQLLRWNPRGLTISVLSSRLKMNRNLVAKYLDVLLATGQVEMEIRRDSQDVLPFEPCPGIRHTGILPGTGHCHGY